MQFILVQHTICCFDSVKQKQTNMANKFLEKMDAILREMKLSSKKELLTFEDACLMLGLSKSYLYKLTSQRIIPFYRPVSKKIFFKRSDLMEWVEKGKVATRDELLATHQKKLASDASLLTEKKCLFPNLQKRNNND